MSQRLQTAPSIKSTNPFSSDDEISDDDNTSKFETIQAIKPYEEYFERYCVQFNNFIDRSQQIDTKYQIPLAEIPFDIMHLNLIPKVEKEGLFDVNRTDYVPYDKIAATFTFLEIEIVKITEIFENKILNVISMYGERPMDKYQDEDEYPLLDGQAEYELSKLFPIFKQSLDLIKKLMALLFNVINQLNIVYYKKQDIHKNVFKNIDPISVFQSIGKGLSVVYVLDCAINQNKKIRDHWNYFKRMIKITQTDPAKFGSDAKNLKRFEKNIARLDKTVLSGQCVQAVLGQSYDGNKNLTSDQLKNQNQCLLPKNKELIELFENYFKNQTVILSEILDTPAEVHERKDFFYLLCTYAFFRAIFPEEEDKKIYKNIWTLQKKVPILEGHTHVYCYVYRFLSEVCPLRKSTSLDPKEPDVFLRQYISELDSSLPRKITGYYQDFCYWIARMESILTSNAALATGDKSKRERSIKIVEDYAQYRIRLLSKALTLASQIRSLVTSGLMLHINEGIGFTPELIKHLSKGIIILKAIEATFISKIDAFQPNFLIKSLVKSMLLSLSLNLDKLNKADAKQKKPQFAEFRASLLNIIKNFRGPLTPLKVANIEFSLNFALSPLIIEKKDAADLKYMFLRIKNIWYFQYYIQKLAKCSFLYWSKDILPVAMKQFFENPSTAKTMVYLSAALNDTVHIAKSALHLSEPQYLYQTLKNEVLTTFKDEYLMPVIRLIDNFLRMQIHSMLIEKVQGKNPFKEDIVNIKQLLSLQQIEFFDVVVDVQREIQSYLNEKFYNINVLNMHDMETYEQMRSLASQYFDISLLHPYIPSQTIEQGQLDILTILKSIPIFIDTHTYNLHNQTFTQITNESKLVQTIGIQQISDSIRTHGLGILNTTVNSVFKYIAKKIQTLSNLLYDELILQMLIREDKWFNEHKDEIDGLYPFDRASKLSQNIKKLGVSEDQKTYLDQFRILTVQIGNALGFVRLLRSASLNYCSKSIEFLPSQLDSEDSFKELARQAVAGETAQKAASELDEILSQLKTSFSSRTDYLKKLVQTMGEFAKSDSQGHFLNFHLLVPCLTQNYVQNVLLCKDRVSQRNNKDAFLCNDGFVIGICYLLKLFNLEEKFVLIHWTEEVRRKFTADLKDAQELMAQTADKNISQRKLEEIGMQRDLSVRRLESNLAEYNLFFNTFQACKILFREDPV